MGKLPIKRFRPIRSKPEAQMTTTSAKKYLCEDFHNRCGYCDALDKFLGGQNVFHVDHFAPKKPFAELERAYSNFVYCCPVCNGAKSNAWVGSSPRENIVGDKGFIDPCSMEYGDHLARNKNGEIFFLTSIGEYIVNTLHLYLKRHKILFKLDSLEIRADLLERKINENKNSGKNTEELEQFLNAVKIEFFDYYKILGPVLITEKNKLKF